MNEYAEMLECQLRFAEEEKEQAVAMAYQQGVEEGKQLATAWIPVTERLPVECGKSYIVCLQNGHIDIATCMHDGRFAFICEHGIREAYDTNPIIAWMPLPEPYKGK